jgi:hypothetical protein
LTEKCLLISEIGMLPNILCAQLRVGVFWAGYCVP